jgi:hypothetical protein
MKTTIITLLFLFFCCQISAQVTASAGADKEVCLYDTLYVYGSGLNSGDTGSYEWKDLNTNFVISVNQSFGINILSMTPRSYVLKVTRKTYNNTYLAYDTMQVQVNALPSFSFKGLPLRCYADGAINLTSNALATASSGDKTITETDIRYFQKFKNPTWVTGGPVGVKNYLYDFQKFFSNANVPKTGLNDTICYEYTDYKGCYNSECKPFRLYPNPVVETKDGIFCQKSGLVALDKLVAKPFSKVGGIQSFQVLSVPSGSGVDPSSIISVNNSTSPPTFFMDPGQPNQPNLIGEYVVEYCFKDAITGCQTCDTSTVNIIKLPKIKFATLPKQCINGPLLILDSFLTDDNTGKRIPNSKWETVEYGGSRNMGDPNISNKILNSIKNNKRFDPSLGAGQYLVRVSDPSNGCGVSDSLFILVNGLPIVDIDVKDTVCANDQPITLQNIMPAGLVGTWSGQGVSGRKLNPSGFATSPRFVSTKVFYSYTHPLTGCTSSDSETVHIQNPPDFTINASPRPNVRYRVDFNLLGMKYFDTTKATVNWDFGSSGTSKKVNPRNIFYADSGTHKAYVSVNYGLCEVLDSIIFTLDYKTVGIPDIRKQTLLYPNPVRDFLSVEFPFDAKIKLYDINGRCILNSFVDANSRKIYNLSELTPGVYLISIDNSENVIWEKIVVE